MPRPPSLDRFAATWDRDLAASLGFSEDEINKVEAVLDCLRTAGAFDWGTAEEQCNADDVFKEIVTRYNRLITSRKGGNVKYLTQPEKTALELMAKYIDITNRPAEYWLLVASSFAKLVMPWVMQQLPESEIKRLSNLAPEEAAKVLADKVAAIFQTGEKYAQIIEENAKLKAELDIVRRDLEKCQGRLAAVKSVYGAVVRQIAEAAEAAVEQMKKYASACAEESPIAASLLAAVE